MFVLDGISFRPFVGIIDALHSFAIRSCTTWMRSRTSSRRTSCCTNGEGPGGISASKKELEEEIEIARGVHERSSNAAWRRNSNE
jgi:hypothetical protein